MLAPFAASSQSATDGILYDAFGMTVSRTGTTPTPFGFVGGAQYQTDSDSGLMLLGNRYYDSSIGRFITQDPIADGDNWYGYVDNNPLGGIDPLGLQAAHGRAAGITLPSDPSGLPKGPGGFTPIPHQDPNGGSRWRGPSGEDGIEFHPKQPGKQGWGGQDHWHPLRPNPSKPGKWITGDDHFKPGEKVPIKPGPTPYAPAPGPGRQGIDWGPVLIGIGIGVIIVVAVVVAPEVTLPALGAAASRAPAFAH